MSRPQGNTKDLNAASSEAVLALVNSLSSSFGNTGTMLSSDAASRLTSKIREFMGEGAVTSGGRREELTNEEGLPIIDITEPVNLAPDNEASIPLHAEEEQLVSLSSYSPEARERWRQERDRILDTLEEEERRAEKRQPEIDAVKREEILRRRKEAAAKERQKMKAAKEMQKKMAKALVRNVSMEKEAPRQKEVETIEKGEVPSTSTVKKVVSFAEPSANKDSVSISSASTPQNPDWGDVALGRLRPTSTGPSLISLAKLPMKQNIVERLPGGQRTSVAERDSDDESEPLSPTEKATKFDADAEAQAASEPPESDSDSSLVEEDYDIDYIQHQREIALQYYEKRPKFNQEALRAIAQAENAEEANADVIVDTPVSDQARPAISRFKANRIASSYNLHTPSDPSSSTSLGDSVLPVSSARALRKAIRTGKLDTQGRLVGPDHDSESDDENSGNVQDILDLLRKGEVTNIGPDVNLDHPANSAPTPPQEGLQGKPYSPLNKPKTSKFKASRVHRPTFSPPILMSPDLVSASAVTTPISEVPRSSPKLPTAYFIAEHQSSKQSTPSSASSSPRPPVAKTSPMIIESPSFPVPVTSTSQSGAFNPLSMIVESPSFPNPANKSASPTPPSDAAIPIPTGNIARLQRPPTVLASTVREASSNSRPEPVDTEEGASPLKKVSRFKAERTG